MINAFQSREFGFGFKLTAEELEKVNQARAESKYKDEMVAKEIRASVMKQNLPESPFMREFQYGTAGEGYWSYQHMVLQVEDVQTS